MCFEQKWCPKITLKLVGVFYQTPCVCEELFHILMTLDDPINAVFLIIQHHNANTMTTYPVITIYHHNQNTRDKIAYDELQNIDEYPQLHSILVKYMMHGPCRTQNPGNVCMKKMVYVEVNTQEIYLQNLLWC